MTVMAAVWCSDRKHASLSRRAVLYSSSSSSSSVCHPMWCGVLPLLQPGRYVRSPALEGLYTSSCALDIRPRQTAPLDNTTLSFCTQQKRKNPILCFCGKEINVTSSNTHISSPSSDPNCAYPSTAALLSVRLSSTLLPRLVTLCCWGRLQS